MRETKIVEKTGWDILSGMFKGKSQEVISSSSNVSDDVTKVVALFKVPYNPLTLSPGDILLLDTEDAAEIRFVVSRLSLFKRQIGRTEVFAIDYVLSDPTDTSIAAAIRAYEDDKGGASLLLLRPDGDNAYDEQLENMLDASKPGESQGFPRQEPEYAGYARPLGAQRRQEGTVTEYEEGGKRQSYDKALWDFIREADGGYQAYLFEMNKTDGYFYAYSGQPLESDKIRVFRF